MGRCGGPAIVARRQGLIHRAQSAPNELYSVSNGSRDSSCRAILRNPIRKPALQRTFGATKRAELIDLWPTPRASATRLVDATWSGRFHKTGFGRLENTYM